MKCPFVFLRALGGGYVLCMFFSFAVRHLCVSCTWTCVQILPFNRNSLITFVKTLYPSKVTVVVCMRMTTVGSTI